MSQTDSFFRRLGHKRNEKPQEIPAVADEKPEEETIEPLPGQMYFSFDDNGDVSYHIVGEE